MYAVLVDEKQNLNWTEVPDPVAGENEVLIEIHAAALNRADLLQRAGKYPPPPGWPEWMGLEVAGIVLSAPADSRWKKGDKVCALLGGGGYAEKVAVPQNMVLPVPHGLSMTEAAALPEAFATSCLNLCIEAGMKSGDTVFIQAGASGLGIAAIQLAKAFGAKVIATVGSDKKRKRYADSEPISSSTEKRIISAGFLKKIRSTSYWTASAEQDSENILKSWLPADAGF